MYNIALAEKSYDDYAKNRNEHWYRSMFMMLLRRVGIITYAEIHTHNGRSDVLIQFKDSIVVLEFKYATKSEGHRIISAVLVADYELRKVILEV